MKRLALVVAVLAATIPLSGCFSDTSSNAGADADRKNKAAQATVKARATNAVPATINENFQARKNLDKFNRRTNESGKIWYVYEVTRFENKVVRAWTSSSYPQSVCTFMTPPEQVDEVRVFGSGPNPVSITTAMALDGVYYKGGDCPDFFFDYQTDAAIVADKDLVLLTFDRPLDVNAPSFAFKEPEESTEVEIRTVPVITEE